VNPSAAVTTAGSVPAHDVQEYRDDAGRRFGFVHVHHPGSRGLGVHFSAFYTTRGVTRPNRADFGGYFHRLKMLGSCPDHDWLFLCDPYGAYDNGTYYTGERGDLYVEAATATIIDRVLDLGGHRPDQVVTLGSSMGATAALKFGRRLGVAGIVAIGPHIDLDIAAVRQNRMTELAFTLPDGDVTAPHNRVITRQVRNELDEADRPPPPLFVQSCVDDDGVHAEQVLPLVQAWRTAGGFVALDERPFGGHTSAHAPRSLLLDATARFLTGELPDPARYQREAAFASEYQPPTIASRLRRRLGLRRRVRRLVDVVAGGGGRP
jgi:hypothetical protein